MSIPLSPETLACGGVLERLQDEFDKVLANIADPNTEAKKPRTVTLKITIKPNEQRNLADMSILTSSSLQPSAPLETSIIIDKERSGKVVASELVGGEDQYQHQLPGTGTAGKVAAFPRS